MSNRTAAVIITIVAVLFCACPGLAFTFLGVLDFLDYYVFNSYVFGITDQNASNIWGIAGICGGLVLIAIAVIVSILVLRKKKEIPTSTDEPIPPAM